DRTQGTQGIGCGSGNECAGALGEAPRGDPHRRSRAAARPRRARLPRRALPPRGRRRMIRFINLLLVMAVIGLSVGLYDIKYRAESADRHARQLEQRIAKEQEAIRVLRAEWSYLNQPERLQELASRYTELKPLTAEQIGSF